jgi:hypothetical protein
MASAMSVSYNNKARAIQRATLNMSTLKDVVKKINDQTDKHPVELQLMQVFSQLEVARKNLLGAQSKFDQLLTKLAEVNSNLDYLRRTGKAPNLAAINIDVVTNKDSHYRQRTTRGSITDSMNKSVSFNVTGNNAIVGSNGDKPLLSGPSNPNIRSSISAIPTVSPSLQPPSLQPLVTEPTTSIDSPTGRRATVSADPNWPGNDNNNNRSSAQNFI